MAFPVKWFSSDFRGSPTINGQAGSLIGALEACLLTGFGEITATSVMVSGGIATAVHNSGDWFADRAVIQVSGATPTELNGESRVLSHTATTTTWATAAADGAATGTIKIRYAPVGGWEVAFSKTNVRVFRSIDPQANGHYLRIDDTAAQDVRVRAFETMSDVDTGTGPFPTDAQMSGGGYWRKSQVANATANKWQLFADSRFFMPYILTGFAQNATYLLGWPHGFGDPIALAPGGDGFCTLLDCTYTGALGGSSNIGLMTWSSSSLTTGARFHARATNGLGGSLMTDMTCLSGSPTEQSGNAASLGRFSAAVDGRLLFAPRGTTINGGLERAPRTLIPGLLHIPQTLLFSDFTFGDQVDGAGDLIGRRLMILPGLSSPSGWTGYGAVDITGPWR